MQKIKQNEAGAIEYIQFNQDDTGRHPIVMDFIPKHDGAEDDQIRLHLLDTKERPGIYIATKNIDEFVMALLAIRDNGVQNTSPMPSGRDDLYSGFL